MTDEILDKNQESDSTDIIDPDDISAELSSEISPSTADNEVTNEVVSSDIDILKASKPPIDQLKSDLTKFADRKLSIYERRLDQLESTLLTNLPDYISAISDVREMNKLKYRIGLHSYDELKSLWLKYIHDIL